MEFTQNKKKGPLGPKPVKSPFVVEQYTKYGKQELPILTNHYHFPGRENTNVKLNVLIDNIWNIPNEHQVAKVKQSNISALYNF